MVISTYYLIIDFFRFILPYLVTINAEIDCVLNEYEANLKFSLSKQGFDAI